MILSTHAIVGAAIASFLPSEPWAPFAAAALGFASHFAIDAIPHWDYPIRSAAIRPQSRAVVRYDRSLVRDLGLIGADGLIGTLVALALFASPATIATVLAGALAAMLPDPLQFVHSRFPHAPLHTLQQLHVWIHTDRRLKAPLGIASQLIFVVAVIAAAAGLHHGVLR